MGGTGFIASHLLPVLSAAGATVYATSRPGAHTTEAGGVHWIASDLTSTNPTAGWPEQCDTLVYLAQSRMWRTFPEGASDVFDVNVRAFFAALEYARTRGVRRFIFASSGSVYEAGDEPARETDAIRLSAARPIYVAAKLSAEILLSAYSSCFHAVCLRLFVPYGSGQPAQMLIPGLVRRVRHGEPIQLDGAHGLRLNPVAVADVVSTIVRCVGLDLTATFNVAGPKVLTLREIGCRIGELVGHQPRFETCERPERSIVGDTSALRAAFGWSPESVFPDGLSG